MGTIQDRLLWNALAYKAAKRHIASGVCALEGSAQFLHSRKHDAFMLYMETYIRGFYEDEEMRIRSEVAAEELGTY